MSTFIYIYIKIDIRMSFFLINIIILTNEFYILN